MRPLAALLEELFALHGHQVTGEAPLEGRSGTVYTIPILAESAGHAIVVSGQLDGSPVTAASVLDFADTVGDVGADTGVLVHTGHCGPDALDAAAGKVVLWSRETVIRLLGEAQVAQSLDETPPALPLEAFAAVAVPQPVPTSVTDLLPPAFLDVASNPAAVLSGFADLFATQEAPAPAAPSQASPPPSEPLAAVTLDTFPVEAPRRPHPQPEEDDLQPFPPITHQPLAPLPPPPPLDPFESALLPPEHPFSCAPAQAFQPPMVAVVPAPAPRPRVAAVPTPWMSLDAAAVAAPSALNAAPAAPSTAPAAFGSLAASARSFTPPMVAPAVPRAPAAALPSPLQPPPAPSGPLPPPPPPVLAAAASLPNPLPAFPNASHPVLPVRVRLEDAKRKVKERLFSVRSAEILLQPVHLFEYECDLLKEGSLTFDTLDGRVQVHGSDKGTLDVDPDQTNAQAPSLLAGGHPHAVEERVLRVADDRARVLAFQHVVAKHTRSVSIRVADHNNGLFYTEKKKVEPTSDQVRLRPLGVFLRPVWRLHGANGVVDVDANDGREVMSEVRGGRTDAILIE